jgi:hypothetical protein
MVKGEKDVPDFKENIASFKAEIARLEAAVKIDRAVYETALVKAKAQIAHEEARPKPNMRRN